MNMTHGIVGPCYESPPPLGCPDRPFPGMQNHFLVTKPALLVQYETSSHTARNELPCAALAEIRLQRDATHRTFQVEDVVLGGGQRLYSDLACTARGE